MSKLTKSMCWDLVVINKDKLNQVAAAVYRKPSTNECYNKRVRNEPALCNESDDPNAAWYLTFQYLASSPFIFNVFLIKSAHYYSKLKNFNSVF